MKRLSNIPLKKFRKFLESQELALVTTSKGRGGHEKWEKPNLARPVILQSHIDPVPEFVVKQILRHLKLSREEFFDIYDNL